ncbi:MAG: DUF3208 domain-containing protein [bacterium]|jgi:hypothetical protein|nr:DUF3208 domain-containing protein [bacterium]
MNHRADDDHLRPEEPGDDRDLPVGRGATSTDGRRAVRLLQGYVWHPRDLEVDLGTYLPAALDGDVHILWDRMPAAPFTFFDDGTLSATQWVYQLTVLRFVDEGEEPATLLAWVAETLQQALDRTPAGVGWQLLDDLRDVF